MEVISTIQERQIFIRDEIDAVKQLEQAQYDINRTFLKIGEILFTISERQLYLEWGYDSLWEFIESNERFEFERRTAEMLMRIWRFFGSNSTLPIKPTLLAEIGYTKSYFLTQLRKEGILTAANLKEWIDKAMNMSVRAFKKEVDKALGKEIKEDDNWVSFYFRVPPEDMDKINEAIYAIAKLEGIPPEEVSKIRGTLLSRVIQDWMDYYSPIIYNEELTDGEKVAARILKIKQQLEALYPGVRVILPGENGNV